jgi:hypothetical protein
MDENRFVALITAFAILSTFFIGNGINGMLTYDQYTKKLCDTDKDCSSPEVCCPFYQQKSGVCNDKSMCNSIYALRGPEIQQTAIITPTNNRDNLSLLQFCVGLMMVLIIGTMLHYFNRYNISKKRA